MNDKKFDLQDGTGMLFRNEGKKEDKHPDAKGAIKIDGVEYDIASWSRTSKNGNAYRYLVVKRKEQQSQEQQNQTRQQRPIEGRGRFADIADDIPF